MTLRRHCLPALFAFLTISTPVFAQLGQVDGYILGPDDKPIIGAVIAWDKYDSKQHYDAKSDKKGYFANYTLPTGDYLLTVTVDGTVRDRRPNFHVSPGRQAATQGNSALGLVIKLKSVEESQKQLEKEATADDKEAAAAKSKAREEALKKTAALNESYNAGKTALDNKQWDDAITNLSKASEVDAKQSAVWSALADAYVGKAKTQKGDDQKASVDKASEAFAKAIAIAPTNAGLYNNYALALASVNKMDDAKTNLGKAIEIDPAGAGKYHYNMGALLLNRGQSDAAVDEFKKAVAADGKYAEAHFQLALRESND